MDAQLVKERVNRIVIEHLGLEADQLRDDARFIDDLGADSLDRVELQMAIEEAFHIEISDAEGEAVPTVGALTALVIAKVEQKAGGR